MLLVGFFLAGAALIAVQIRLMKRNRQATADMDRLLTHIHAAGNGQSTGMLALPEDSDLREAAASLAHMEDGLRSALEDRMKSERTKIELIANVSHDLKTPLTSIVSYVELLQQEEGLPEHVQDYIRILAEKSQRLQVMVRDVFEVSKAAARKPAGDNQAPGLRQAAAADLGGHERGDRGRLRFPAAQAAGGCGMDRG